MKWAMIAVLLGMGVRAAHQSFKELFHDWSGKMTWTQPVCEACWLAEHPDNPPTLVNPGPVERCCLCGAVTKSGIYIRKNPEEVPFPRIDPLSSQ